MTDIRLKMLQKIKEEKTLTILSLTEVKLRKKDRNGVANPFPKVYKVALQKVLVNKSYAEAVNEQREAEGKTADFEAQKVLFDGDMVGCTFEYNGQFYVKAILLETKRFFYQTETSHPVSIEAIKPFMTEPTSSRRQGVEETVKVRKFNVKSILAFDVE